MCFGKRAPVAPSIRIFVQKDIARVFEKKTKGMKEKNSKTNSHYQVATCLMLHLMLVLSQVDLEPN